MFVMLKPEKATIWSMVGGYLLLPSSFYVHFIGLPAFDKKSVTIIATFFLCLGFADRAKRQPIGVLVVLLALTYELAPIATSFGNSYELQVGGLSLRGFYIGDAIKQSMLNLIDLSGLFIGWRVSTPNGRAEILKILIIALLAYSFPILFEVRFSPQLHTWVYGFFPHEFGQQMRWGGFRAVVFLQHGLQVALFVLTGLIACFVSVRLRRPVLGIPARLIATYCGVLLILCKSLGTIFYGAVLAPVVLYLTPRIWIKVASVLLIFVCAYPALRSAGMIPTQSILRFANGISVDRGDSLNVRISNEDQLLQKALKKSAFGWGNGGRNRVFSADSGRDVSITDGGWIIVFGSYGWMGYLSLFGLLTFPVLRLNLIDKQNLDKDQLVVAGLAIILAINIFDMLPNNNISAVTFMIAGSILGYKKSSERANSKVLARAKNVGAAMVQKSQEDCGRR
jgi:hypothetical protein